MSMISEQVNELRYKADIYNTVGSVWELNLAEAKRLQAMLRQAADTIESISAKLQEANMERSAEDCGGWIPCKERLPDQRDNYLCTMKSSSGHKFRMIGHYNLPGWTDDNKMQQTIAWQSLPDQYHEP